MARVLIIDDDDLFSDLLSSMVIKEGHDVVCASTLTQGMKFASSGSFDIVFLDVKLPDGNGLERLPAIRDISSTPEVIIITGAGTTDGAEQATMCGAWDYIQKPSTISNKMLSLRRALQYREEKLKRKPPAALKLNSLIGKSSPMKSCYELIAEAANSEVNVLVTGETGTGKELFARAIHENSRRSTKTFVVVDCAALQQNLAESTLFGYEKGAFTGAEQNRDGLIKHAHGGTLFLDEIGELPLSIQKNFLRVLQERSFRPLGSTKEIESDFRLIAATNRHLDNMVQTGQFRDDLLFRLRSLMIEIPPLREHPEDIEAISLYHTERICKRSKIGVKRLSSDFIDALFSYKWPGNVRELVNALERAIAASFSSPTLFRKHLPRTIRVKLAQAVIGNNIEGNNDLIDLPLAGIPSLKDFRESTYANIEKQYLHELMLKTRGDTKKACQISGVGRTRLYNLLKKHKISAIS